MRSQVHYLDRLSHVYQETRRELRDQVYALLSAVAEILNTKAKGNLPLATVPSLHHHRTITVPSPHHHRKTPPHNLLQDATRAQHAITLRTRLFLPRMRRILQPPRQQRTCR